MGIGWVELLIILGIVIVIFGAKKLRNIGSDLGGAIKNFKQSMREEDEKAGTEGEGTPQTKKIADQSEKVVEGEVISKTKNKV